MTALLPGVGRDVGTTYDTKLQELKASDVSLLGIFGPNSNWVGQRELLAFAAYVMPKRIGSLPVCLLQELAVEQSVRLRGYASRLRDTIKECVVRAQAVFAWGRPIEGSHSGGSIRRSHVP